MVSSGRLLSIALRALLLFACGLLAAKALGSALWATGLVALLGGLFAAAPLLSPPEPQQSDASQARARARLQGLELENRRLQTFLDHTPTPLLILGGAQRLEAGNKAARALFGADRLIAEPPPRLLPAIREAVPGRRAALRLGEPGAERNYALIVTDLSENGRGVRLASLVDIQAELQAAEAGALKDFVHVLSHEIMNSLTPVTSLAQTARQLLEDGDPASTAEARGAVETLARRSEGLLHFVESYRQLARVPDVRPQRIGLAEVFDQSARLFRSRWSASGVVLTVRPPPPERTIQGDPDLLTQALMNLLDNAAQASSSAERADPRVELAAEDGPDGQALIRVADNGSGVEAAEPQSVFRPFFTTKPSGTGVGLSLVRQIVLAHGGEVTVQAHGGLDGGAAFLVRL